MIVLIALLARRPRAHCDAIWVARSLRAIYVRLRAERARETCDRHERVHGNIHICCTQSVYRGAAAVPISG